MKGSRRLLILLGIVAVLALGLVGFYVWLAGGSSSATTTAEETPPAREGLVHVRSIYVYDGSENIIRPMGLGSDGGGFFVTLADTAKVVEFDRNGEYVHSWGERGTAPGQFLSPVGVDVDRLAGHVYVADRARLKLIAFDLEGTYLWEMPVLNPISVSVDDNGDVLLATFGPLAKFSSEGESLGQVASRGPGLGQFDYPRQTAPADDDTIYVADTNNARLQAIRFEGEPTATVLWSIGEKPRDAEDAGTRFLLPSGVAMARDGRVVLLDSFRHTIEMFESETGEHVTDFGGERRGVADATFNFPTNIAHLYDDYFAVTDTGNDRIQIVRLITPEQRQVWNLYPLLRWLAALPLLGLLLAFGRRRHFISDETMARAIQDGNARLLLAATKRPYVLPDTYEHYADFTEEGVRVGDHLRSLDVTFGETETAEERLASAASRSNIERVLGRRHVVVSADEAQAARFGDAGARTKLYDELVGEYAIKG
ncbi:MAG: hypothetical protein CVT60_02695 [Actinobacteria bacterium HGW-Actinobacteria-10]|nr:MAG: hypothetical protein CVT60_02695 [Actinobacteria bacterium HGW-Actinobacteria-10]